MIGFIGGGNMAEALIKGILQDGNRDILVSEPRGERRSYLEKTYGIKTTSDNKEVCTNCRTCHSACRKAPEYGRGNR